MTYVTENIYVGDGVTTQYGYTFPVLAVSEVFAEVGGVGTTFTEVGPSTVEFAVAPGVGVEVRLYRSTSIDQLMHEFQLGAPFLPRNIDNNNNQLLYAMQENADRTKTTAEEAVQIAEEAKQQAANAEQLAQDALDLAQQALDTANTAVDTANDALAIANGVRTEVRVYATLAAMRTDTRPAQVKVVIISGHSGFLDGSASMFWWDESDTTSPDNDILTVVDSAGKRWKRVRHRWIGYNIINVASTALTLNYTHLGMYLRLTAAEAVTVEIPNEATLSWPVGAEIHIRVVENIAVSLTGAVGVTLNAPNGGAPTLGQNMTISLKRVAPDVWDIIGQTEAA